MSDQTKEKSTKKRRKHEEADGESQSKKKRKSEFPEVSTEQDENKSLKSSKKSKQDDTTEKDFKKSTSAIPLPTSLTESENAENKEKRKKPEKSKSSKHSSSSISAQESPKKPKSKKNKPDDIDSLSNGQEKDGKEVDIVIRAAGGNGSTNTPNKKKKSVAFALPKANENYKIYPMLEKPEDSTETGYHVIQTEMHLSVQPVMMKYSAKGAINNAVAPLLMSYYRPLKGVLLGVKNAKPKEGDDATSKCVEQYSASYMWITMEALVFRPLRGSWLQGVVALQTETHITLVVNNYFNARIERNNIPRSWNFVPDDGEDDINNESPKKKVNYRSRFKGLAGSYHDGHGNKIPQRLVFRAVDFDVTGESRTEKSLIHIEGNLLTDEEEKDLKATR